MEIDEEITTGGKQAIPKTHSAQDIVTNDPDFDDDSFYSCYKDDYEMFTDEDEFTYEIPAKVKAALQMVAANGLPNQVLMVAYDVLVAYLTKKEY
jgi:hypothetical protein